MVHLARSCPPGAVEREVPCDAHQPGAKIDNCGELVLVLALEDADEGVLNNVFGFGRVAQDGERDAVEEGRVIADKRGEVGLSYIS